MMQRRVLWRSSAGRTSTLGYYIALAAMLNAFDVHPPKGLDDPPITLPVRSDK
jgi:hypothetical protein